MEEESEETKGEPTDNEESKRPKIRRDSYDTEEDEDN